MKQTRIPAEIDEITAEWMQHALIAGGFPDFPELEVLEFNELSDPTKNMMGHVYRCQMTARDHVKLNPASVIVKLPTSNATAFKFAKWMSLYQRECVFYRDIAPYCHIRIPSCFFSDFDVHSHRFVLLLEDLGGMAAISHIDGVGIKRTQRAIGEIASFQGQFWDVADAPALANCGAFLSAREGNTMQMLYLMLLPLALERFSDLFTSESRRMAEIFGSRIGTYFATNSRGPKTVVHGDYRADNALFGNEDQIDFAVIDWQGCGLGCGMYDVAFFMSFSVTTDDRRRIEREIVDEYHDIVCRMGARNYSRAECWRSYRQNMLGTLIPIVLGSGKIDVSDQALVDQTRNYLGRTLAAIEDLDAWEFIPAVERYISSDGALSIISKGFYKVYSGLIKMRKGKTV